MTTDVRLEMNNCNMIFTEKQQQYKHYHLEKFIDMNIFQVKKYYLLIKTIMRKKVCKLFFRKSFTRTNRKTGWYFKVPKPF